MSDYYLLAHPPVRDQFRRTRRARPTGCIVVHTAENTPDLVLPDDGAEAVARFIRTRKDAGSYHILADSDSLIRMMPFEYEAYQDGTGSNRWAVGISAATKAAQWPKVPVEWRDGCISWLAVGAVEAALWLRNKYGIDVPGRRITRAQSEAGMSGFISHGERDPGRRSDPGPAFPWDVFFERYAYFLARNGVELPAPPPVPRRAGLLVVDGILGPATVSRLQESLNRTGANPQIPVDGWVRHKKLYLPDIGPKTTYALQRRLNHTHGPIAIDSVLGPQTIKALQRNVGVKTDGLWGPATTMALQRTLNAREL